MPRGWATIGTGELIRDYLISKDESYPRDIYRYLHEYIGELESSTGKPYEKPSYSSVRKYLYVLQELGLITFTREEPVYDYPTAFKRRYYQATPGRENDPAWGNPYAAKYFPEKLGKPGILPPVERRKWRAPVSTRI